MKREILKYLRCLAGILAGLVLLETFCMWYYSPAVYVWDETRATDNIREPGALTSRATEGFALSRMDGNGYNNPHIPEKISVLLMGSSHTEGLNVAQDKTIAAQLQERSGRAVYSIGISKHNLMRNIANLPRALERFEPEDYVVIETMGTAFSAAAVGLARTDAYDRIPATDGGSGLLKLLSGSSFLCGVYRQYQYLVSAGDEEEEGGQSVELTPRLLSDYEAALTELFRAAEAECEAHGCRLAIVYHPHLIPQIDGSVQTDGQDAVFEAFSAACENAGVKLIDMKEDFLNAYAERSLLPHGFVNTAPAAGHLNAFGCGLIADALNKELFGEVKA